jgi:hypothetical protein
MDDETLSSLLTVAKNSKVSDDGAQSSVTLQSERE